MTFAKNCKKSGEWEPRGGRRCTEKSPEHDQGQDEDVRLRSSNFLEETEFRRRS